MGKAIKWAWTYGSLHAEVFDSLGDAIEAALDASGYGEESFDYIDHDCLEIDMSHPDFVAAQKRRDEEWEAHRNDWHPVVQVELKPRDKGYWVALRGFEAAGEADAVAAELESVVGADRVRVTPIAS